jgi:hypothetical protein
MDFHQFKPGTVIANKTWTGCLWTCLGGISCPPPSPEQLSAYLSNAPSTPDQWFELDEAALDDISRAIISGSRGGIMPDTPAA